MKMAQYLSIIILRFSQTNQLFLHEVQETKSYACSQSKLAFVGVSGNLVMIV